MGGTCLGLSPGFSHGCLTLGSDVTTLSLGLLICRMGWGQYLPQRVVEKVQLNKSCFSNVLNREGPWYPRSAQSL